TSAVSRGTKNALVIADLPFMSYQASVTDALHSAGRFMKEAGVSGVKLEGGQRIISQIQALVDNGIPVMGHIGLTPQSYHQLSGYTVQGKSVKTIKKLIDDAIAIAKAGAFSLVLEGVPSEVGKMITEQIPIPTIGIGAGPHCDGQIQVFHDILGLYTDFIPKHTRQFGKIGSGISEAVKSYMQQVAERKFPAEENVTHLSAAVLDKLSAK
ncbi:MAG: 3-methyl-2-oxobutanoate hydroxymethyltransferase, partial [Fidelibacterota bacterium]